MKKVKKKRILFISQSFPPSIGGVSTLLYNLCCQLNRLDYYISALHFDVSHQSPGSAHVLPFIMDYSVSRDELSSEILRGYAAFKEVLYLHFHDLSPFGYSDIESIPGYDEYLVCLSVFAKELASIVRTNEIDLIHLHDYQLLPLVISIDPPVPTCVSIHAPITDRISPIVVAWIKKFAIGYDYLVLSIPRYAQILSEKGIPEHKLAVIAPLMGMELRNANPSNRLESDINASLIISAIQRFDSKSGHVQLIKAFAKVAEEYPNILLRLVGGKSFTDSISDVRRDYYHQAKSLVYKLGINKLVRFEGGVDYGDLGNIYENSNIIAILSKMECFGIVVSEAMSYSLPVIVTNVGGLAFQVEHQKTGLHVPVGNIPETARALSILVKSQKLREQYGNAGYERFLQYFQPKQNLNKQVELYRRMVHEYNSRCNST